MFRKLTAKEIDVRTQSIVAGGKGAILLLYKDARCDMNILDETVGAFNWKREHKRENANCVVSIWDKEKEQWISKEDTGSESNQDAQKGLASDSFKRACFNWGIGRELYTSPLIYVSADKVKDLKRARYECQEVGYDKDGNINKLVITSENKVVYSFGENVKTTGQTQTKATEKQIEVVKKLYNDEELATMLTRLKLKDVADLNVEQASKMISTRINKEEK